MDLAKNLKIESVCRLNPTPPLRIRPGQSVRDAIKLMKQERVGCLLVCEDKRIVGIFTERDLTQRVLAVGRSLDLPIADFMTPDPVVVKKKAAIATAIRLMQEGGYRHLPVVDESGMPVGVLSVKRIIHYLVEHFPATVYNLPPDPDTVQVTREGA